MCSAGDFDKVSESMIQLCQLQKPAKKGKTTKKKETKTKKISKTVEENGSPRKKQSKALDFFFEVM